MKGIISSMAKQNKRENKRKTRANSQRLCRAVERVEISFLAGKRNEKNETIVILSSSGATNTRPLGRCPHQSICGSLFVSFLVIDYGWCLCPNATERKNQSLSVSKQLLPDWLANESRSRFPEWCKPAFSVGWKRRRPISPVVVTFYPIQQRSVSAEEGTLVCLFFSSRDQMIMFILFRYEHEFSCLIVFDYQQTRSCQ